MCSLCGLLMFLVLSLCFPFSSNGFQKERHGTKIFAGHFALQAVLHPDAQSQVTRVQTLEN